MIQQDKIDFDRIAKAIDYLKTNFKSQPDLDEVASIVHISPTHFQKMFTEWSGVSPKKFLQYLTIEHAKQVLSDSKMSLFDAAIETGLSGSGRLHDLFINIEQMTPGEYKNGGQSLQLTYQFADTFFGRVLIVTTAKGITHLAFVNDDADGLDAVKQKFSNAMLVQGENELQLAALKVLQGNRQHIEELKLHLKGTAFQLKVWEALLRIPMGQLTTYGALANFIEQPGASRAVGTAIGSNPIAYIIPCHRVIQSGGLIGGYMWGPQKKTAILGWEAAKTFA